MSDNYNEASVLVKGKYIGFRAKGKIYLQRCPECDRENYSPAVALGQCAWCGWDGNKELGNEENKTKAVSVLRR